MMQELILVLKRYKQRMYQRRANAPGACAPVGAGSQGSHRCSSILSQAHDPVPKDTFGSRSKPCGRVVASRQEPRIAFSAASPAADPAERRISPDIGPTRWHRT